MNWAVIISAGLGSGAFAAIVNFAISRQQEKCKKSDGVQAGVRQLLYDRIKYLGKTYLAKEEISSDDLEDLMAMHKIYHDDLSGNGYLDELMNAVKHLKIVR